MSLVVNQRRNGQTRQRVLQSWLHDNVGEIYSIHNEGNSFLAEKFIRTLKNKISKYMTVVSKYVHINMLDETVDKYNNIMKTANKMKTVDVESGIYIEVDVEHNYKDYKSKVGDHVKIGPKKFL